MYRYQIPIGDEVLEIYRFRYEPVDSNMYFIPIGETGIVIDPNINEELLGLFKKKGTKKVQIILTHEHYDHTSGVLWLIDIIENSLLCQEACARSIASKKGNNPMLVAFVLAKMDREDGGHRYENFKKTYLRYTLTADDFFVDNFRIRIGNIKIQCIPTPGHTPGSACYLIMNQMIFTGDSLIQNTPTITRFPESNRRAYNTQTLPFLKSLDKNILVFPGHGNPFKITEAKYL